MPGRYLLTGCAGFIASRVADLLLQAGHTVVGVDSWHLNNRELAKSLDLCDRKP